MEYKTGDFGYFEYTVKSKLKGCGVVENTISGHFRIIDQDKNYLMLSDGETEPIVARKNITKFKIVKE